jgi:BirA family biotin operon repressor/biotin-[acetyl-CoA-carboxylase] ligase
MAPVSHLSPDGGGLEVPSGTRFGPVEHVPETGSTNADLAARAADAPDGLVRVTDYQTAGRGRLDRRWDAPPGTNLLVSVLVRPRWTADRHPLVTTALAVAAVDTLVGLGVNAAIKWPNDVVLVDGPAPGKVAGILAELVSGPPPAVIVGLGLNVGWPLTDGDAPPGATSLTAAGTSATQGNLLAAVLAEFEARLGDLEAVDGSERLRAAHRDRSATVGSEVRVEASDGPLVGTAVGLDLDGSLLVDAGDGPVTIRAGDVVHLRPV